MRLARSASVLLAAVAIVHCCARTTSAHPLSQGFLDFAIHPDRIALRARICVEEVIVSTGLRVGDDGAFGPLSDAYKQHGQYLLRHLYLNVDGRRVSGEVRSIVEPRALAGRIAQRDINDSHVEYTIDFPLENGKQPGRIKIEEDVLNDIAYAPGQRWEATYTVKIGQESRDALEGLLLTSRIPVFFTCERNDAARVNLPAHPTQQWGRWETFTTYLRHGINHIIGWADPGYDHLLFVSALALGALSLWDLVKLVTVFTLAHTLTLTLCVLNIVRLSDRVVEPVIAASIVFVAFENIFWPNHTRGWGRLAAAFVFGLFHGLGFAGGLLDAMSEMHGAATLTAIVAFSIGVELGHQVVVVPLFGILQWIRRSYKEDAARERFSKLALRYGSVLISMAGMFYLAFALGWLHA